MIVLTADEAEKVRGLSPTKSGCAIEPVLLKDGRFMLPLEVLDDPAHVDVRGFLAALPQEPLDKLPVYTEADFLLGEAVPDDALRARVFSRRDEPKTLDETEPDALAAIDGDGTPRKPA